MTAPINSADPNSSDMADSGPAALSARATADSAVMRIELGDPLDCSMVIDLSPVPPGIVDNLCLTL
jgi:hypothetical protein